MLQQYCIDTRWFESYLCDHYQQVTVRLPDGRGAVSRPMLNPIGIYQGLTLGPLLFSMYTADMYFCVNFFFVNFLTDNAARNRCLVQYADDTQLAVFGRPRNSAIAVTRIQQELTAISLWLGKNGLKFNEEKTQLIVIRTKQILRNLPPITVNFIGANVTGSPTVKNLGVTFDQNLTFADHVTDVTRRCTGVLSGLSHCRRALPGETLIPLVQALVVSSICYCISVCGMCGATQRARLQKLLNSEACVISSRRKYEHISDVLKEPQWVSAENLWRYHLLTMLKCTLHSGQPESLRSGKVTRGSVHGRSTRQADSFETPVIHTESGRRRFLYSAVSMYLLASRATWTAPPPAVRCSMPRVFAASAIRRWVVAYVCVCLFVLRRVFESVSVLPIFTYAFYIIDSTPRIA